MIIKKIVLLVSFISFINGYTFPMNGKYQKEQIEVSEKSDSDDETASLLGEHREIELLEKSNKIISCLSKIREYLKDENERNIFVEKYRSENDIKDLIFNKFEWISLFFKKYKDIRFKFCDEETNKIAFDIGSLASSKDD